MTTRPETQTLPADTALQAGPDLGLVMGGGGARAVYQVGFLCYLARQFPDLKVPIVTGVSSGGINAAHLASHHGSFGQAVREVGIPLGAIDRRGGVSGRHALADVDWSSVDFPALVGRGRRRGPRAWSGGYDTSQELSVRSAPCGRRRADGHPIQLGAGKTQGGRAEYLELHDGQSLTWIQGQDLQDWTRPQRRSQQTVLTIDHVMASSALPLFFPAVEIGDEYFGDGGVRQSSPLSPAIHLGAEKILAISTRYNRTAAEARLPEVTGYPPPAQVLGVLLNSVFLDLLDQDALRLERLNQLLHKLAPEERDDLRPVKLLVLRPSVDLGRLANEFESQLPTTFRFLTRGLGTRQTKSPDFLSMVLFQPDYIGRLIEIGEADAEARADEIDAFIRDGIASTTGEEPHPSV